MNRSIFAVALVGGLIIGGCNMTAAVDREAEKQAVEKAIRDNIGWPLPEKDFEKLYSTIARDSSFFIFHPDSASTITSFAAFDKMVQNVFMNEKVKPTSVEIRDLRVNLSQGGDVAWFSCILDDFGEYDGQQWAWLNCRWTGVLQKTDGKWLVYQMHFSFASDAKSDSDG